MKKLIAAALLTTITSAAHAVCPVCTVGVAAGLGVSRWLGIDDVLTGIWIGGLTVSLIFWTASYLKRRGIRAKWAYLLNFLGYYALTFSVYLLPDFYFGSHTLWGIDKLFMGIVVGSIGLWMGSFWYENIKKRNGGHAQFKFQKVAMPIGILLVLTAIFSAIIYL